MSAQALSSKPFNSMPSAQMPPPQTPARMGSMPAASPFGPAGTIGTSVIGTDLTILGRDITIISKNRVQIDGDIRGDVAGREVTIGADGSVLGTVSADKVDVHGGVRGSIKAAAVFLHPSAQVDAEILHQTLSVAEGAQAEGYWRKSSDKELRPNLDAGSYPAAAADERG
jgi:cytoskeletal protein CcmA (bactofilin family)